MYKGGKHEKKFWAICMTMAMSVSLIACGSSGSSSTSSSPAVNTDSTSADTVSYTHLDVYKRQLCPLLFSPAANVAAVVVFATPPLMLETDITFILAPFCFLIVF